jgi:hypothetical protein
MILHKETLLKNISESEVIENIFDQQELDQIWKIAFENGRVRKNRFGNIFIFGDVIEKAYNIIKHKILIDGELWGGNYFITTQQYGLHIDSFAEKIKDEDETTVYKNIIIPLWIGSTATPIDGGQLILFEQRLIDYSCDFNKGEKISYKESLYKMHADYSDLQFYDRYGNEIDKKLNNIPFDKAIYKKYFNTPYERLDGLTIENIFDWIPGNMFVIDAIQVHASTAGVRKDIHVEYSPYSDYEDFSKIKQLFWLNKMGLLLKFKVKI